MKAENLKLSPWDARRQKERGDGLVAIVAQWIERARERNTLAHLDALARRDLGLSESDVWAETRKAPWQA